MKKQFKKLLTLIFAGGLTLLTMPSITSYAFNREDYDYELNRDNYGITVEYDNENYLHYAYGDNVTTAYIIVYTDEFGTIPMGYEFCLGSIFDDEHTLHREEYSDLAVDTYGQGYEKLADLEHGSLYKYVMWYPCGKVGFNRYIEEPESDHVLFKDQNKEYTPAFCDEDTEIDIYEVTQDDIVFLIYCIGEKREYYYYGEAIDYVKNYIETEEIKTKWELTGETKLEPVQETETVTSTEPEETEEIVSTEMLETETSEIVSEDVQSSENAETVTSEPEVEKAGDDKGKVVLPIVGGTVALAAVSGAGVFFIRRKRL